MKVIAIVFVGLALSSTAANAQNVDPRCSRMYDKIGCTCAVQNGGYIPSNGKGWRIGHFSKRNRQWNEAYVECLRRWGRV